jgi:hypothetical protein
MAPDPKMMSTPKWALENTGKEAVKKNEL